MLLAGYSASLNLGYLREVKDICLLEDAEDPTGKTESIQTSELKQVFNKYWFTLNQSFLAVPEGSVEISGGVFKCVAHYIIVI